MVSAAASAWTIWEQKYANHALGAEWSQTWPQRAVDRRQGHLVLPLEARSGPTRSPSSTAVWNTDATHAAAFLPLIGVAVPSAPPLARRAMAPLRPVFFAAAYFVVSLFPVLSFFNVYFFRYSFVGDHFQYLASMGPLGAGRRRHRLGLQVRGR